MPDSEGNFIIELSDFLFVTKGIRNGKALRLSVTWKFDHPQYGLLGETTAGCLVRRNTRGKLEFSPPVSRLGPGQSKQLHRITPDLHDLVVRTIADTKYAQYIGAEIPEELRAKMPQEIDPSLPSTLSA